MVCTLGNFSTMRLRADTTGISRLHRREEVRLIGPLSEQWDASRPAERQRAFATIKESLAIRAYLRTVVDDLNDALGENQEGYVTNRRH